MKKNIFLWSLYDFANSIIMIVFLFYFSQWLVVDSGKPDWWYNATLVISSLLFILTAPVAGQRLDVTGRKIAGVRVMSVIMFIFFLLTALVTLFTPSQALLATTLFTLAMYFYLMSFVYYTPMINDLSTDVNRGWVSGLGLGGNYAGQVFGLLVTLPFATGAIELFGAPGRAQTLIPAIILFAIFALPLLLKYKETVAERVIAKMNVGDEYAKVFQTTKTVFSIRNLSLLFIAYFIFSDALLTFANNFPIFLEKVFSATDSIKTYLTAGILTLSGVGSLIFGKMADKKGTKFTLSVLLTFWIIFFPALAFAPSLTVAAVICLIAGLFFGPVWSVSRAMVAEFTPRGIEGRSFSFYTLAERFATFVGPIMWSVILVATAKSGNASYSYALVGMGVLLLLGFLVVRKIKSERKI
ncbi:MAG: MFS transporter [Patescibacteria group bacterium]